MIKHHTYAEQVAGLFEQRESLFPHRPCRPIVAIVYGNLAQYPVRSGDATDIPNLACQASTRLRTGLGCCIGLFLVQVEQRHTAPVKRPCQAHSIVRLAKQGNTLFQQR